MGQEVPRLSSLRHILLQHEHPTTHHATCSPPLGSAGILARNTKQFFHSYDQAWLMGQEVPRLSSLRHILLQHEHPTTHHATCSPPLGSAGMHARTTSSFSICTTKLGSWDKKFRDSPRFVTSFYDTSIRLIMRLVVHPFVVRSRMPALQRECMPAM